MRTRSKLVLSLVPAMLAALMGPAASYAQPYNYSDVVPTPTECDAANPGGAFAAWVQLLPSKKVQLELNSFLPGASAAVVFSHITQYANGQTKTLPANSFQFTAFQPSSTGTAFPVVEYTVGANPTVHVLGLSATALKPGFSGITVFYDMHANGVPANARLVNLYLLSYALPNGQFFSFFNNFYINGNPVHNKNFTTYPCLGDIAVQVVNFTP